MIDYLVQPNKDSDSKIKYFELFDPPGLFHVGQREWPNGNCYVHHLRVNETPCTPSLVCILRDKFRDAQDAEIDKTNRLEKQKKRKKNSKQQPESPLHQEFQQQQKYQRQRVQTDWNPLEDFE